MNLSGALFHLESKANIMTPVGQNQIARTPHLVFFPSQIVVNPMEEMIELTAKE
jgi:hypothetical protein